MKYIEPKLENLHSTSLVAMGRLLTACNATLTHNRQGYSKIAERGQKRVYTNVFGRCDELLPNKEFYLNNQVTQLHSWDRRG